MPGSLATQQLCLKMAPQIPKLRFNLHSGCWEGILELLSVSAQQGEEELSALEGIFSLPLHTCSLEIKAFKSLLSIRAIWYLKEMLSWMYQPCQELDIPSSEHNSAPFLRHLCPPHPLTPPRFRWALQKMNKPKLSARGGAQGSPFPWGEWARKCVGRNEPRDKRTCEILHACFLLL